MEVWGFGGLEVWEFRGLGRANPKSPKPQNPQTPKLPNLQTSKPPNLQTPKPFLLLDPFKSKLRTIGRCAFIGFKHQAILFKITAKDIVVRDGIYDTIAGIKRPKPALGIYFNVGIQKGDVRVAGFGNRNYNHGIDRQTIGTGKYHAGLVQFILACIIVPVIGG